MFCTTCGAKNSDDNFFCIRCGAKLMRIASANPQQGAVSGARSGTGANTAVPLSTPAASPATTPTMPPASVRPPVWQKAAPAAAPASARPVPAAQAPVRQAAPSAAAAPAYPAKPVARHALVLKRKDGTAYALGTFPITVGKGTAADVRIDGNSAISRVHVRIGLQATGYVVEDCGSTNGTRVNGNPVPRGGRVALAPGDRLTLGNEDFSVARA